LEIQPLNFGHEISYNVRVFFQPRAKAAADYCPQDQEGTLIDRKRITADAKISRRGFLKTAAIAGGIAMGGSLLSGCGSVAPIVLDLRQPENQPLATVGGTIALDANSLDPQGILLYRSGATTVLAFSRKCTHLGCTIGAFQNGVSTCPCHGSQYDTQGSVVRGPSQSLLRQHTATVSGLTVTISA
jgi:nitrite reductase/ring-hydroxylating ferredoxin subunit